MFSKNTRLTFLLAASLSLAGNPTLFGQCTDPCSAGATDSAVGVGLAAFRINPDGTTGPAIGSGAVGSCQCIRLRMNISYVPFGPSGGTTVAFSGGQMVIQTASGSFVQNVTPAGGVPIIGPPGANCNPATNFFLSTFTSDFCVSNHLADVSGGKIAFQALYGPAGTLAFFCPAITNQTSGSTPIQVNVAPAPTCSVAPATNTVCQGGSASFTVTPVGTGPFTFSWTGPGGFTSTNATITINNAQPANAGVYTATARDAFGCPTTCSGTLVVIPAPTCVITPTNAVCAGTTNVYTTTISPSGGTVTYGWTISGSGVIVGPTNAASVTVIAGASGTYTLTDNITRNGCPGQCAVTIPINPLPSCSITGPNPVPCIGTNTYTSTVTPSGGTVTHSWSITGNGTIVGSTTGASVTVVVNSPTGGSFTLTDTISRNGCPGQCSTTVIISPCPPPCIAVTKQVACFLGNNQCGTFAHTATGVSAEGLNPAFCYMITVSNCGTVALTNVSVIDTIPGQTPVDLTADFSCITGGMLAANTGCSFTYKAEVPGTDNTINVETNTVNASGQSIVNGQSTNASASAVSIVIPASVTCNKEYTIDGGPLTNDVTIADQNVHTVVWYVTVHNTGLANLENVQVTDETANLGCRVAIPTFRLDAGASTTFPICTNAAFVCSNGVINTVTVTNTSFTYTTNRIPLCNVTLTGSTNQTIEANSECSATIICSMPLACRVTGGGRQDLPNVCPTDVRYVTHGGQVGAPVGNKVCVIDTNLPNFFLGNPCIHGRWTHVRHQQGGGEGNFHARFFDTLDCACLDTNLNTATCQYGAGTVVDGLCNPGDRCAGPEPRKAPANKIAFTGVGDWTCEKGGREPRSCLFRVDIEDRGEPGNDHALDANRKACRIPDRYRIRIWVLTDAELAELNGAGPDPYLIHFRDCISACNGINFQDGGVCGPNTCSGDTCTGLGTTGTITFPGGCPVRSPNIDDGGELLHGNHQIHPSIKSCDPANPTGPGLAKP